MRVLVTGATGLLGNNIVRLLCERGADVDVLVREGADPRPLEGLNVAIRAGDVTDAESVKQACREADAVIHAAGFVHIGWTQAKKHRAVNVEGARNAADAADERQVRLVHVSSIDALGVGRRDQPAGEDSADPAITPCPYALSKREAEQVVLDRVAEGLDAVIVNPALMLGPWDWKPSSGEMLLQVAQRFTPVSPSGGCNVCDVRDVAEGVLAALDQGVAGRRYILGGENMTYLQCWRLFAEISGAAGPWFKAGPIVRAIGGKYGDLWSRLTGREAEVNSASVGMASQYHYFTSARAERELGYHARPVRETIADAWAWFQQHGYV